METGLQTVITIAGAAGLAFFLSERIRELVMRWGMLVLLIGACTGAGGMLLVQRMAGVTEQVTINAFQAVGNTASACLGANQPIVGSSLGNCVAAAESALIGRAPGIAAGAAAGTAMATKEFMAASPTWGDRMSAWADAMFGWARFILLDQVRDTVVQASPLNARSGAKGR